MTDRSPERVRRGLIRALVLSVLAGAIPVAGAFLFPESLADYEALTWLLLLVPAFLWAYERGWRGIATALAFGMAAVSTTYVITELRGSQVPDLLLPVIAAYIVITLAIGKFGERVARGGFDATAETRMLLDPQTGLPNRRQLDLHLELEFAAAQKGRPLTIVLFDIDGFSEYNARYGRAAGDGVLRGFASLVQQHTRRMDLGARYAPDAFLSVLGGALPEGAMIFATRLLERMRTAESTVAVPTVSAGIATFRPEMTTFADLLQDAERALEQAQKDGGDRIRVFGRSVEPETVPAPATPESTELPPALETAAPDGEEQVGVGRGRSAFLLTSDTAARDRLAPFLREQGFQLFEGTALLDALKPLQGDFDLVFVDLAPQARTVADLVRAIRSRSPTTRVVGIPRTDGGTLPAEVLDIRVDAHYLPNIELEALQRQMHELLAERDSLQQSLLRHRQLSDEIRAIDRESRAALEASEAKYRTVVENIEEVIFTTNADGVLTFLNPAWTEITGFDAEESLGRPLQDFLWSEDANELLAELALTLEAGGSYLRHEGRWRTRRGGERWVETRMQLDVGAEGLLGTNGVMADITERRAAEQALRQSEEYFRSLIENSSDMVAVLNADGTIRYVSPAIGRVLGRPPAEWIGANPFTMGVGEDAGAQLEAFNQVVAAHGSSRTTQARAKHADGSLRHLEITYRNLLQVPGVEGVVVNARDVTERHESERALRESTELLLRAQKMDAIGRLAGGVAHDFNNLLTAIQGHTDLLLNDVPEDTPIRADLMEIRDAARRATSLTRQLLAFSRRQVMQPRVVELNDIVSDIERMLRRVIGEDVELFTNLSAEAGCVRADVTQLEQVLLNLIVNARDAMPAGGTIEIRTEARTYGARDAIPAEAGPGDYIVLEVTDNGGGMTAEVAAHAFDPFFTTKPPGQGTGLGLSTVYGIVKQSGGHVWLDSTPGTGTRVTILLPRVEEAVEVTPAQVVQPAVEHAGTETILLVEDEKSVRDLAVRILQRRGYQVLVAQDGRQALELAEKAEQPIDLLLTDVIMPGMNGQDVAEQVRALRPDIRVLFMSGYNEEAVLRHGVLATGAGFIEKPFSPSALLERVRGILSDARPGDAR